MESSSPTNRLCALCERPSDDPDLNLCSKCSKHADCCGKEPANYFP